MKYFMKSGLAVALMMAAASTSYGADGWPSRFEGVMLQGFYWDSYSGTDNTKWATLTAQADELAESFKLIWVPNSAKAANNPSMGYDPVYWFTQHNSSFGSRAQLDEMISTFKEKGTGIIADVVINHRSGVSNWTNFPTEVWKGKTYKLGPEHICSTDEVRYASGQATPTGAPDTGEDFDGSRDLDHTNATVQDNCKDYCKFLLEELGYAGFRLDMTKGYAPQYTKIYNNYSNPTYCVGEYWDGSYDALAGWIEGTGKTSAAFDFAFKYAVNDAFYNKDYSKLCWMAGSKSQPAGLIHNYYQRYAVTFIDNHDTCRDDWNKFNGNIPAANAFMLSCPGTPCVFYKHWLAYKNEIKAMIAARNEAGIHNESAVNVITCNNGVYLAEVTGKYGTLAIKIGSQMVSPEGYTNSDIRCTGTDYCIWVKTNAPGPGPGPEPGDDFKVYFDNSSTNWTTPHIHYWGRTESTWPGVAMAKHEGNLWTYTVPAGTTGLLFNAGDGDATKTDDFAAMAGHVYTTAGSQGHIDNYQGGGDNPNPNLPANVYLIGNLESGSWITSASIPQSSKNGSVYTWTNLTLVDSGDGSAYFSFVTSQGADWNAVNASDRYGSSSKDEAISIGSQSSVVLYKANVNASAALSWKTQPGIYTVSLNLGSMSLSLGDNSGVETLVNDSNTSSEVEYYDLTGRRILNPQKGLYIVVRNGKPSKEFKVD